VSGVEKHDPNVAAKHGKIVRIAVIADPERLRQLDLAVLND
jgi:hypothetical protein